MTDPNRPFDPGVQNTASGTAQNVTQARDIYGNVTYEQINTAPAMSQKTKVVLAVVGVVIVGILVWVGTSLVGHSAGGTNSTSIASHIEQCETQHQLTAQNQTQPTTPSTTVFDSCSWPPSSFTDADGYTEITAQTVFNPDADAASDATTADRITGRCRTFDLAYDFTSQGDIKHLAPFPAAPGLITSLDAPGQTLAAGLAGFNFTPGRDEVDVVHNDNNVIANIKCLN
jgi:hypothetical protein